MSPYIYFNEIHGVIFDWDGVIAETQLDFSAIRQRFFGGRRAPLLEEAAKMPPAMRDELMKAIEDEEMRGAEISVEIEGARCLTEYLNERGIPWCILSRNCRASIDRAADVIGFQLPKHTFSRESQHVKPDPRAMTDAAAALGADPRKCLVIGDFLYELLGARRAGMRAVLVQRDGEWRSLADAFYPKMTDFADDFIRNGHFVPWEYHSVFQARGADWLERCRRATVHADVPLNAKNWQKLLQFAALGTGTLSVDEKRAVTAEELLACGAFRPRHLEMPMTEVLEECLSPLYPLLRVTAGTEGASLSSPDPALALECAMK